MPLRLLVAASLALLFALPPAALAQTGRTRPPAAAPGPADAAGAKDHPLAGRYDGAVLKRQMAKDYEELRLARRAVSVRDRQGEERLTDANSEKVAGKYTRTLYEGPAGRSALEVARNYEQKLTRDGFERVFGCRADECGGGRGADLWFAIAERWLPSNWDKGVYLLMRKDQPGGPAYVAVYVVETGGQQGKPVVPSALVDVVETASMDDGKIVFVDAAAMNRAILSTGHVSLYGILFDFDKAEILPESRPTLEEVAKFLKANPWINLIVAGHTDGRGGFDYNVQMSQRRAAAVVAVLVKDYGIAGNRLTPFGAGMAAPVASNDNEAGRAKNRRVELVKR